MLKFATIVISLLLELTNSICGDGCLRCNQQDQCLVCDFSSSYFYVAGECQRAEIDNCAFLSQDGRCLSCEVGFYLDSTTFTCVKIQEENKIPHCVKYFTSSTCLNCEPDFYQENGVCVRVFDPIPGCVIHGKEICLECDKGLTIHPNRERCVKPEHLDNCRFYSYLFCDECRRGYFYNPNYYMEYLFGSNTSLDLSKTTQFLREYFNPLSDSNSINIPPCQPVSTKNCEHFLDNKCLLCEDKFFLTIDNQCLPYSLPAISNCEVYSSYNVCEKCR